jgi:hypothetical protein
MCKSKSCEPYYETHVELATAVFKTQNKALVNSLKNFLTLLPNSQCIEEVLKAAIFQLPATDPEACLWLLHNSCCLDPEFDLIKFVMESVTTQLQDRGFVLDRDFWFGPGDRLCLNEQGKAAEIAEGLSRENGLLGELFLTLFCSTPSSDGHQ